MTKITIKDYYSDEDEIITTDEPILTAVSLFECWTKAYDASKLTDKQIEEALEADDLDDFAFDNDLDEIELNPAERIGTDNDYHIVEHQSTVKAIVKDVNGIDIYEGGVRDYMECFGESWDCTYYTDEQGRYDFIREEEGYITIEEA